MPARLPQRCGHDCVNSFRAAATRRYQDGLLLADSEARTQRTGAIYLWGYSTEMVLKGAVFATFGYQGNDEISRFDLNCVPQLARSQGINWTGGLHAVEHWGRFLIILRAALPGSAYPAGLAGEVILRSVRISQLWTETLRYHANVAYTQELAAMRGHTEWFVHHAREL